MPWLRHFAKGFETLQNRTNSFGSWFHRTHVVSSHPEASLLPHCSGMRQQQTGTRLTFNFYILLPSCIESKQTHTYTFVQACLIELGSGVHRSCKTRLYSTWQERGIQRRQEESVLQIPETLSLKLLSNKIGSCPFPFPRSMTKLLSDCGKRR